MAASIDALIVFSEAAAAGSFSAAARKLGRSQSTVSTIIADLEIDVGVTLFDRTTRKPRLTAHGEALHLHREEGLEDGGWVEVEHVGEGVGGCGA